MSHLYSGKTKILLTVERGGWMDAVLERAGGLSLTREDLEAYLEALNRKGRSRETLDIYRRNLRCFYDDLPEDKTVRADTLDGWRRHLLEKGYSPRTVNVRLSTVNSLMDFLGRRDLQSMGTLGVGQDRPELTRAEYLRLLSTARALDKERLYLLVKLFGCTDLALSDLPKLTVPAVRRNKGTPVPLPDFLRRELLDYARAQGIVSGPLFQTKSGKPLRRTAVTDGMKQLCRDAQVAEEKVNPRCLRHLWKTTREGVYAPLEQLAQQAVALFLETEQRTVGWKQERR